MGVLPIPSTELNETEIVYTTITSEPVTKFRKTFRGTASRDLMNFFRKPKDSFSAWKVGLASRALITFLTVGLLSKNNYLRLSMLAKLACPFRTSSTGAQLLAMYLGFE